jgi:hypothetical protein
MRIVPAALLHLAMLLLTTVAVAAEPTLAQAEHQAAGLKQGMALDDVRKLLGTPRRTVLRSEGNSGTEDTKGRLQWTYTWAGVAGPGTLLVNFLPKGPDAWRVTSWEWATY